MSFKTNCGGRAAKFFMLAFAITIFSGLGHAINVGSFSVTPEVWLGESINMSAVCVNGTASGASVNITSSDMILNDLAMTSIGGGAYSLTVPGNYFTKRNTYTAFASCTDGNSTGAASTTFLISELKLDITSTSSPAYEQDIAEIVVVPKKNDATITSGVFFVVTLDGAAIAPAIPPIYEPARGWVLRVQAPAAKTYTLGVVATYQGKSVSASRSFEVKPLVEFSILSTDRTSFEGSGNITMTLRALKRGSVIPLENLAVRVNGAAASIISSVQSGTTYTVIAGMPALSAGRYPLVAEMTSNSTLYYAHLNVSYVAIFTGKLGTKGVTLTFSKSGATYLTTQTLDEGYYSNQIVPDTYDVLLQTTEAEAEIRLGSANVNSLNDAIKYSYTPMTVEGFHAAGVYYVNIPWSFGNATVKLRFDPTAFDSAPFVYKCSSWTGSKCLSGWTKIIPEINDRFAKVSVSSFSAFVVGTEEKLRVSATFDKKRYAKRDIINVKGFVTAGSDPVFNASLRLRIDGTYVDHTIFTNGNGAYNFDFIAPDAEGNFSMNITAKKQPYIQYSGNYNVEIINMPSFSVVFPSTIQVGFGNKTTQDILIVNTGQADITGLSVSTDLDGRYVQIGSYSEVIPVKKEVRIPVTFYAGDPGTMSGRFTISSNELSEERTIGFTTLETAPKAPVTALAIAMPGSGDLLIIGIFAAVAFSSAFVLKRFRSSGRRFSLPRYSHVKVKTIRHEFHPHTHANNSSINNAANNHAEYLNGIKEYMNRRTK